MRHLITLIIIVFLFIILLLPLILVKYIPELECTPFLLLYILILILNTLTGFLIYKKNCN